MPNPYVNKVVQSDGTTLIDITDTTAVASDVAAGKYFYAATGQKMSGTATGGTAAISVVDTQDSHGGTVRTITALDISDTTAAAEDVASGKYFYTAAGVKTSGTASGGGGSGLEDEIITRTISGTYENSTVTTIGSWALAFCSNLTVVSFPNATLIDQRAFVYCNSLSEISASNVTRINTYAFGSCFNLNAVRFPNVSIIESYAFINCLSLSEIYFPSVTSIGSNAFSSCRSLKEANFPLCSRVDSYAFANCSSLSSVKLSYYASIYQFAFASCTSLSQLSFISLNYIGAYAFTSCTALKSFYNLHNGSVTIESYAFSNCSSLEIFEQRGGSFARIGQGAFYNCTNLSHFGSFSAGSQCNSAVVSGYIGSNAFYSCTSLIGLEVTGHHTLYQAAFGQCSNINKIAIAPSLIGSYCFQNCRSLTAVWVRSTPSTTTSISLYAFNGCWLLRSLYLAGSKVMTLNNYSSTFSNSPIGGYTEYTSGVLGSIFVRESLYESYISATNWAFFSSQIVSLTNAEFTSASQAFWTS